MVHQRAAAALALLMPHLPVQAQLIRDIDAFDRAQASQAADVRWLIVLATSAPTPDEPGGWENLSGCIDRVQRDHLRATAGKSTGTSSATLM